MEMSFDRMLGIIGIVLAVIGIAIGVGVAIAMDPKSKGEMMFSISCFIFSGLVLCLTIGSWGFLTDISVMKRVAILILLFAASCVSTIEASRWVNGRYQRTEIGEGSAKTSPPETHGTTDSVEAKPQHHSTEDTATAKVGHPAQSTAPSQSTIIQTQAPYGNLARRCEDLGGGIIRFVGRRYQMKPMDPRQPNFWDWYRVNDGQFRAHFYDDAKALQKDLASVNIKDRRLDELMERHERYFVDRNRQPVQTVIDHSMMFHLSIEDIGEIGERFQFLATQIPH